MPVEAPVVARAETGSSAGKVASFFSAGVDSIFTLLSHNGGGPGEPIYPEIDDLLVIWGLDIPLSNAPAFRRGIAKMRPVVSRRGVDLVPLATNPFSTRWRRDTDWGQPSHGSALALAGLGLERRYDVVRIPSTFSYGHLALWGSTPLTDELHSTSSTRIVHDGAGFTRFQKTEHIANRAPDLLDILRVCWETKAWGNCGRCEKSLRTMAALEILGSLDSCGTFENRDFSPAALARVYSPAAFTPVVRMGVEGIRKGALARGRTDVARAIRLGFVWSRWVGAWLRLADWLENQRFVWRFARPIREFWLGRSFT